jgi:hypothetical protein
MDDAPVGNPLAADGAVGEYNLSNLPPNALPPDADEPEASPTILALPLRQTHVQKDAEKDTNFDACLPKEASLAEFARAFSRISLRNLDPRATPRLKISTLNDMQDLLQEIEDLADLSDPVYRGLEKSPGFAQANPAVNQLMLDIFRHVFVKSSAAIRKSTVAIIIPFAVNRLGDRRLRPAAAEFVLMVAEAICPSFVLQQTTECVLGARGYKAPTGKAGPAALETCVECLRVFGAGELVIGDYIPLLLQLLQSKAAEVRTQAAAIATYLYRSAGSAFEGYLEDLPEQMKNRLHSEFEKAADLPAPSKGYLRRRSGPPKALQEKAAVRVKLTNALDLTAEQIAAAEHAKKWKEQSEFLGAVEAALGQCKQCIFGADLEALIRVFRKFVGDGNQNLVKRTLAILEQIAQAADKDIGKYAGSLAQSFVAGWSDNQPKIREQATRTINAFLVHSGPNPFIRAIACVSKPNNCFRAEFVNWILSHSGEIPPPELERLVPIVVQCLEDKAVATRQTAVQVALIVRENVPDSFDSHVKTLSQASQRLIGSLFDGKVTAQASPIRRSKSQVTDELPKYASLPSAAKKLKRLRAQPPRLGLSIISNRQNVLEKARADAQANLPPSIFQKLFSTLAAEQIDGFQDMKLLLNGDSVLVAYCSDIFVRLVAARFLDKNTKSAIEGIAFLMLLFADEPFSVQELEVIVPVVFWAVDSKSSQIGDAALDLLFLIRTHSDPMDLSAVLRSCLETCGVVSLVHLFSELQFTVMEDSQNASIFVEIVNFAQHKSIEVAAACGGVLSMLCRRMRDDEKSTLFESLTPEQRESVSAIIPIELASSVDFEAFHRLSSMDKVKSCRRLLERLRTGAGSIQSTSDVVLASLLQELTGQETDWAAMKLIAFSLHSLLMYCTFQTRDLKRTLLAITFFANRWQRKLVLLDGLAQTVNSILFKLFEKIPPLQIFSTLLEGMNHFRGTIPVDSFYCKCWVVVSNQLMDLMQAGDAAQVIAMAKDHVQEFGTEEVRGKLCNALALTASGKKAAPVKEALSPAKQKAPAEEASPIDAPPEKREIAKVPVTNPKNVADLKNRLQQLRNRINK